MRLTSTAVACGFKEVYMCACAHMSVHAWLPLRAHECAWGGQRSISGVAPRSCLTYFMRQDFLLGPGACQVGRLGRLASEPQDPPVLVSSTLGYEHVLPCLPCAVVVLFLTWMLGIKPGSSCFCEDHLTDWTPPQPLPFFLKHIQRHTPFWNDSSVARWRGHPIGCRWWEAFFYSSGSQSS